MSDLPPALQPRKPPFSLGQRFAVAFAVLMLLFSGGCAAFGVIDAVIAYSVNPRDQRLYVDFAVLFISGPFFFVVFVILLRSLWTRLSEVLRTAAFAVVGLLLLGWLWFSFLSPIATG